MGKPDIKRYIDACSIDGCYSDDLHLLQKLFDYVPIFVYGTEKQRMSNSRTLSGFRCRGTGTTLLNSYIMYKTRGLDTEEPVVLFQPGVRKDTARIQGELYIIPVESLAALDSVYEVGLSHTRIRRLIEYYTTEDKDKKEKPLRQSMVFMYVGIPTFWEQRLKKGGLQPMHIIHPEDMGRAGAPYYTFLFADDAGNRERLKL